MNCQLTLFCLTSLIISTFGQHPHHAYHQGILPQRVIAYPQLQNQQNQYQNQRTLTNINQFQPAEPASPRIPSLPTATLSQLQINSQVPAAAATSGQSSMSRPMRVVNFTPLTGDNPFNAVNASTVPGSNPFNDRNFILYRPQTPVVANIGQEKSGNCPVVRTAKPFAFSQFEGTWFKRYRSRLRTTENNGWRCSHIHYIHQGGRNVFILDNNQNNQTMEWFRQNATSLIHDDDQAIWTSTLSNGVMFDTHAIYFDSVRGIVLLYACNRTPNGHNGIANIYTRTPDLPLSSQLVASLEDVYYQNGIYDTLPLHPISQDNCAGQYT